MKNAYQIAGKVLRRPPKNLTADKKVLFEHEFALELREYRPRELRRYYVTSNGFLIKFPGALASGFSVWAYPKSLSGLFGFWKYGVLKMVREKTAQVLDDAVFVTDDHSDGYFHWIADVLPKLLYLEKLEIPQNPAVLIPQNAQSPWYAESLEPFPQVRPVLVSSGAKVVAKRLLVLPNLAPTGNYFPPILRDLGVRFRNHFSDSRGKAERRIWISRSQAPRRKLINEDQLRPVLAKFGVDLVIMEDLTFGEQVTLMSQTTVLLGLHGAGLVNMVFMPEGGRVVEIRIRNDRHNNCYYSLASALNHEYYYLETLETEGPVDTNGNHHLDPVQLNEFLQKYFLDA